eukprot:2318255-Amphidinium_carterae.1
MNNYMLLEHIYTLLQLVITRYSPTSPTTLIMGDIDELSQQANRQLRQLPQPTEQKQKNTGSHTYHTKVGAQYVSKQKDNRHTTGEVHSKTINATIRLRLHQVEQSNKQEVAGSGSQNLDRSGNRNRTLAGYTHNAQRTDKRGLWRFVFGQPRLNFSCLKPFGLRVG